MVGPRGGGAGGPSLGQLQVGTDIWRICCHGNREIWKRGAEGGAEDASQAPPPTSCHHHDNIDHPRQRQEGWGQRWAGGGLAGQQSRESGRGG